MDFHASAQFSGPNFCHIWGKICNETSKSHREAATFVIKKFKICKIPVNSMFQTSVTLNM